MATQQTMKRGGLYCVCGGPGGISCTNSTRTPGISMHKFPSKEKKADEWKLWVQFVRKHRSNFTPTNFSAICSAHFETSCYPLRYSLGIPSPLKPRALYLNPCSVPTIDTLVRSDLPTPESARHRRKMIREMLGNKEGPCSSSTLVLEESDREEETTEEQPDELSDCNLDTRVDDSVLMPDDVLESSFASIENHDDLEVQGDYGNTSISFQDRTPPVSCKICKKRKKNIRLLQRKNKKLERELKFRDKQIKALKSEKKILEKREKSISIADDEVRDIMMDEDEKSTADEEEDYENVSRQTRRTKEGKPYIKVTYPKYKLGDELVREISVAPTYEDMKMIFNKYKKKVPEPLAAQFENRLGRKDAIKRQRKRKQMVTELFPAVAEQEKLLITQQEQQAAKHKRKAPTCRKCKQPMKGHSKSACENQNNSL